MASSRKDFLTKLCISGACICGFSAVVKANKTNDTSQTAENNAMMQDWIAALLESLTTTVDEETRRKIIKTTAQVHFKQLKMDEVLAPYEGKLDNFIAFIQEQWGWKINYNKKENVLIADENKNHCVCPISELKKGIDLSAMCYCSEGFAEKMFGMVIKSPVQAQVVKSIRKGDQHCVYEIKFL